VVFSVAAIERLFKVLGDESRLQILQALSEGERSVSEILDRTGLAQTLASFHLRILREAGVLATERRGPFIYYRLADPSLPNLLEACAKYAESLTDAKSAPDFQWPPWVKMCRMMQSRRR
jgi:DNA-binding transcriptional ArsR family regulator